MKKVLSIVLAIVIVLSVMPTGLFSVTASAETADNTSTKFTINWRNSHGELLGTTSCDYGEIPIFVGDTPVRESDSQYTYTFAGWKPEIKAAYSDSDYIAVYNKTARKSYTITYNANGGSNAPAPQTKAPGQTIKLNSGEPTWQNHVFLGWSCAHSDTLYQAGENFNIDADVTLYAVWKDTCSYCDGKGGSYTYSTCTTCNGTGDGSVVKCAFCYGTGRKCANCGNVSVTIIQGLGQVCSSCGSTSRRNCASCDGRGTWTTDYCTTCGGNGTTSSYSSCYWCDGDKHVETSFSRYVYLYSDDSLTGSKTIYTKRPYQLIVPSKTGYTFIGWFDSPDGGTQYTNGEGVSLSVCPDSPSSKLYAHWSLNYYTITYDCEQNVNTDDMPVVYTVEDEDFILNSQSPREHYNFYWSVLGTKVESFDTSIAQDVVVKGVWDPINYTITYNLDGGTANNRTTYNIETDTFSLVEPTKAGYIFTGWTGSNGNVPEKNVTISTDQLQNLSFTANWSIAGYTITYELYGGVNALKNPATFTMYDNIQLKAAKKDYHTFVGWYLDPEFTKKITNINGYHKDLTLYACFVPDSFTAIFDAKEGHIAHYNITLVWGGNLQNEIISYKSGDTFYPYELEVPSRSGYLFNGWYLDSSFSTPLPETYTIASDTKLYAKWFKQSVSNAEELTLGDYRYTCYGDASKTVYFYVSPEHSGETVVSYYLRGYKYDGVMERKSEFSIKDLTTGTTLFSKNTLNGSGYTVNSFTSITLVAGHTYQLYTYTINNSYYNGEADIIISIGEDPFPPTFVSSAFATYEEKYGETIQYPVPIRKDYDFVGWYDIDGNLIHSVWDYTTNKTFYPQWKLHEFTINYNLNGGINSSSNPLSYTIADSTITLLDPSKEEYTFLGWYTDPNFKNQITEINCADRLDYTLYAKWISDFFGINYELNGGVNNPSNKQRIGRTEEFTLMDPTREGYTFAGWYLESYYSTKVTTLYGSAHRDQKVYAKWTPNSYTATLDYSGGQNCPTVEFISQGNVIKSVDLYKDTTLSYFTPEAPAANLKFAGWYTNSSCTTLFNFNGIINYDVTVYAKWVSVNTNYEYVSLGDSYNVSISGIESQYLAIMSPITQTVTVSSVSGLDLFGSIYDSNMKLLYSCDDISDANLDFSITFVMEVGKVYYIAYKANQVLVSGTATINVSGTQNPSTFIIGDYTEIIERVDVIYASSFALPVPKRNGYVFLGWFDENDTQITDGIWNFATNKNLTAKWAKCHTVVFKDLDGNIISSETYYFGEDIVAPDIPLKAPDETYIYHAKWDNSYTGICTGDAVYSPTFDKEYIEYTVIFADKDGTELSREIYHWGDEVTAPPNPTRAADKTYTYTFAGWDKTVVDCAGDATYTATYNSNYIEYTVVFNNWDGSVISTKTYHYGDVVTVPENPVKDSDGTNIYVFAGWDKTVVDCVGGAIYTATYTIHADHIYDNACDAECNICGDTRTIIHDYEWIIDRTNNCGVEGVKHEECTICHVKRNENTAIPASGAHSFDNACDTTCNTCDHTRTITHSYKTTWDENTMQHWHQCSVCGNKKDLEDHIFDNACDTTCNTCGYTRTITHDYKTVWEKDATKHWHECSICGTKKDTADHIYNNACDTTCNTCAYVRTVGPHVYDNVCDSTCNICGFRRDNIEHSYDNACDATCNLCGTIRTPGEHVYDDNDDHYCNVCNLYTLLRYQINYWNNSVTITGFDENYNGAFVIPETINGYPVTEIESYAFYNCSNLTSITIPNSISRIWASAFSGCDNLSEVHISDISAWCNIKFSDLDSNPISCGYFGDYYRKLFLNGSLVTDIVIPDSITAIGDYAFYGYSELKSVEIPDSVTSIGHAAFRQCTKLEGVVIPNNVITIGSYAFTDCESMKTLTLGNQVAYIGECTFAGCDITEVTIPKSVTTMGNVAFCGDTPIKIEIENIESWCNIQFNGAIVWQEQGLNLYMNGNLITDLVIPEGVTTITNGAFAYCTNLKSVSFPNSLIAINDSSFYGCTGIISVVIPQNVSSFSVGAFKGCTALASLSVVDNNATYHSYGNCIIETDSKTLVLGIKNSTIPSDGSVTIIGDYAFEGCDGLKYVVIPDGVTTLKGCAFGRCKDLVRVDIPNSVTEIESAVFYKCVSLDCVVLPEGLTTLNQFVFNECYSLTNITIPKSMTNVMYAALRYCPITNIYYSGDEDDKALMEIGGNNGSTPYATWHYNTCETHTYDNACDATCNRCSWTRSMLLHTLTDASDMTCNVCKAKRYTIVFKNYDGSILSEENCFYGENVIVPSDPLRPDDGSYIYTFTGWDKYVTTCSGNAVYTALYDKTKIAVTSVVIKSEPNKLLYIEGETFDKTGMVVIAHYNNGKTVEIKDYTISGYSSTEGTKTITVTYSGCTALFTVNVLSKAFLGVTSDKYLIENNIISAIKAGTTVKALLESINEGSLCKVYNMDGTELSEYAAVGTGMTLAIVSGTQIISEYVISVTGDINGDGTVNAVDSNLLKRVIAGTWAIESDGNTARAADISGDGTVNAVDSNLLKRVIAGM